MSAFDTSDEWADDRRLTLADWAYIAEFTTARRGHYNRVVWPIDELEGHVDD